MEFRSFQFYSPILLSTQALCQFTNGILVCMSVGPRGSVQFIIAVSLGWVVVEVTSRMGFLVDLLSKDIARLGQ